MYKKNAVQELKRIAALYGGFADNYIQGMAAGIETTLRALGLWEEPEEGAGPKLLELEDPGA